jgi:putative ABC transport system permease protein
VNGLIIDSRAAFRRSIRDRGLTVVALTSLAVGIGVSVAIMSVSTAVLVRPLPYDDPRNLVMIWRQTAGRVDLSGFWDSRRIVRQIFTPKMVLHWKEQELPFADFAVFESWDTGGASRVDLLNEGEVYRLRGTCVRCGGCRRE